MKVLMKRENVPIVKPFDEVIVELLGQPREAEREIALKEGGTKKIEDYSIMVRVISGKFESVTEKIVTKTEDGDEVVKPRKYDASELKGKVIMKLPPKAFEVLYEAWENQEIGEGTKLRIKVTKRQNKTYFDEIAIIDEEGQEEGEEEREEEEEQEEEREQVKPKRNLPHS